MMLIQQTRDRIKNEMIPALWIHSAKAVDAISELEVVIT